MMSHNHEKGQNKKATFIYDRISIGQIDDIVFPLINVVLETNRIEKTVSGNTVSYSFWDIMNKNTDIFELSVDIYKDNIEWYNIDDKMLHHVEEINGIKYVVDVVMTDGPTFFSLNNERKEVHFDVKKTIEEGSFWLPFMADFLKALEYIANIKDKFIFGTSEN